METIRAAVIKTLLYSDIFDYPLKKDEIWRYLISSKKINRLILEKDLKNNPSILNKQGYFFLKGRKNNVSFRLKKEKQSSPIIHSSKKIIKQLSIIPTIKLIGISGSLSMKNSTEGDDIDLFVIASRNTVWVTRLFLVMFLIAKGRYRRRDETKVAGKFCLNMIIDEGKLGFAKKRQNLYTAHEIIQMLPIVSRDDTYDLFLKNNQWVLKLMPNCLPTRHKFKNIRGGIFTRFSESIISLTKTEIVVRAVQKKYMKAVGRETILDNFLAFHPRDDLSKIVTAYIKKWPQFIN